MSEKWPHTLVDVTRDGSAAASDLGASVFYLFRSHCLWGPETEGKGQLDPAATAAALRRLLCACQQSRLVPPDVRGLQRRPALCGSGNRGHRQPRVPPWGPVRLSHWVHAPGPLCRHNCMSPATLLSPFPSPLLPDRESTCVCPEAVGSNALSPVTNRGIFLHTRLNTLAGQSEEEECFGCFALTYCFVV